eukprot:Filipodium_phascolosomae@DN6520_c0_g1_i1.p2
MKWLPSVDRVFEVLEPVPMVLVLGLLLVSHAVSLGFKNFVVLLSVSAIASRLSDWKKYRDPSNNAQEVRGIVRSWLNEWAKKAKYQITWARKFLGLPSVGQLFKIFRASCNLRDFK